MAYGQILPIAILEIPRIACLNLHASLLPRHRGAAPIQAASPPATRKQASPSCTMDEGLDTGDILCSLSITIAADETGGSLHDRLAEIAPAALAEALAQLESGSAPRVPQDMLKRPTRQSWSASMDKSIGRNRRRRSSARFAPSIRGRAHTPFCAMTPGANESSRSSVPQFSANRSRASRSLSPPKPTAFSWVRATAHSGCEKCSSKGRSG